MIKVLIVTIYNLSQLVMWTTILVLLFMALYNADSFQEWGDSYDGNIKFLLEITQGITILDMLFCSLGWTPQSLSGVAPQILARLFAIFLIFPFYPKATETTI